MAAFRTTARGVLFVVLLGVLAGSAAAKHDPPYRYRQLPHTTKPAGKQLVFPILGRSNLTMSFGDPRGQGAHQGEDIMADRWTPALAAEAGRVRFHTTSGRAGCMLYLDGLSGTKYLYVHLNNDLTRNSNDNGGRCVAGTAYWKGLRSGAKVEAGQPIGYVGNSGDAEGGSPHLHFEVHPGGGAAVDPIPYLRSAKRLLFYVPTGTTFTLALSGKVQSVGTESVRVTVATLRTAPFSLTLRKLMRTVTLTVPVTALVERGAKPGVPGTPVGLESAKTGEAVTLWTEAATATPEARAGKAGVLSAERIVLPAG